MTLTIVAAGLRKRHGSVSALDGLDLEVEEGHVVGLLGPNGAGNATALRIPVGLVHADAGRGGLNARPSQPRNTVPLHFDASRGLPSGAYPDQALTLPRSVGVEQLEYRSHRFERSQRPWPEQDLDLREASGAERPESVGDLPG
jgi:ABC-type multidrug transport system ATPase subunit